MSRYINADATLKRFEELHGSESDLLNCYNADWIVSFIEEQPTADVQKVKHGHWILRHVGAGHYWECSVCHTNPCIYITENTRYCPNCGAKMDEEERE